MLSRRLVLASSLALMGGCAARAGAAALPPRLAADREGIQARGSEAQEKASEVEEPAADGQFSQPSGTTSRPKIRFLTDQNVPIAVNRYLQERGHDVITVRTILPENALDPVVAKAAMRERRVLITWDKDFKAQRYQAAKYAKLNHIGFSCPEPHGVVRLRTEMELVESEWLRATRDGARLIMKIGASLVAIKR